MGASKEWGIAGLTKCNVKLGTATSLARGRRRKGGLAVWRSGSGDEGETLFVVVGYADCGP